VFFLSTGRIHFSGFLILRAQLFVSLAWLLFLPRARRSLFLSPPAKVRLASLLDYPVSRFRFAYFTFFLSFCRYFFFQFPFPGFFFPSSFRFVFFSVVFRYPKFFLQWAFPSLPLSLRLDWTFWGNFSEPPFFTSSVVFSVLAAGHLSHCLSPTQSSNTHAVHWSVILFTLPVFFLRFIQSGTRGFRLFSSPSRPIDLRLQNLFFCVMTGCFSRLDFPAQRPPFNGLPDIFCLFQPFRSCHTDVTATLVFQGRFCRRLAF